MTDETTEGTTSASIAADTMTGDLLAALIDEFKHAPDVWQKMSEATQSDVIFRVRNRVRHAVKDAVHIIASANRPTIVGTVESVTIKDGIKAVISLSKTDPQRHALADAAGSAILMVVASDTYDGGTEEVKPEPDQPPLNGFNEE
jgi:hypothetical protein